MPAGAHACLCRATWLERHKSTSFEKRPLSLARTLTATSAHTHEHGGQNPRLQQNSRTTSGRYFTTTTSVPQKPPYQLLALPSFRPGLMLKHPTCPSQTSKTHHPRSKSARTCLSLRSLTLNSLSVSQTLNHPRSTLGRISE